MRFEEIFKIIILKIYETENGKTASVPYRNGKNGFRSIQKRKNGTKTEDFVLETENKRKKSSVFRLVETPCFLHISNIRFPRIMYSFLFHRNRINSPLTAKSL
jgi:hypothetical protein